MCFKDIDERKAIPPSLDKRSYLFVAFQQYEFYVSMGKGIFYQENIL
jgi:hypothetical protein